MMQSLVQHDPAQHYTHDEDFILCQALSKQLTSPFVIALVSLRAEVGSSIARWARNAANQKRTIILLVYDRW